MKKLLSKVLFLTISSTLLFTSCEDDEEKVVNNGLVVGEWELMGYSATYERVVTVPAGEDKSQRYKHVVDWDANGDAATAAFFQAIGGTSSPAYLGASQTLIDVGDGENVPGFPRTLNLPNSAALTGFGVDLELVTEDAPAKGEDATYKVTGTYPTVRQADCQTTITVASITDQGLYKVDVDKNGNAKLGNFMIQPDPTLGGAVLAPFMDGTYTITEGVEGSAEPHDQMNIKYLDRDGHDARYSEVQSTWNETDDRVIQGYGNVFNDADGNIAASDPNPAVLNPAYTGGYLKNPAIPAFWGSQFTFYFYNISVQTAAQAQDAKNPLTDLDGDGTIGAGDMIVFMHYDNLAGGGGKTAFGVPFSVLVDSSNPQQPVPVNDSDRVFSGANAGAGGKMYFKVREAVCVPTNELIDIDSYWERIEDHEGHDHS
tara:strand:- start:13143 stop:14429 length:1287 start_codon:yes stop_codon:yes gene_type:complete